MIATLEGAVSAVGLDTLVVEVGGVGLLVHTTPATATTARISHPMRVFTTLVVREDSLTLYGFASAQEKTLFEQVQTVSGVGPRLALAMLAVHEPGVLVAAISQGNIAVLTKVPGIGKKGAERIVLELRDKVLPLTLDSSETSQPVAPPASTTGTRVAEALVGLGWSTKQADDAVEKVAKLPEADGATTPVLLRLALRELGR